MTFNCEHCDKSFENRYQLSGHQKAHNGKPQATPKLNYTFCTITNQNILTRNFQKHLDSLKNCKSCGIIFKPKEKNQKYCTNSCSNTETNKLRIRTEESKNITGQSVKDFNKRLTYFALQFIDDPTLEIPTEFSIKRLTNKISKIEKDKLKEIKLDKNNLTLYPYKCNHCKEIFYQQNRKKYCSTCAPLYLAEHRNYYKFTFNVFDYPDLFDLELIKEKGFFSPGGKAGKWNPEGISRDHKISVTEAIKNGYNPFYITHPLNCELMPHKENHKKFTKSSISYEKLKKLVHEYELSH